mmetsp:Transcript_16785/g.49382  ORF Transcript_16785/g.49382 Transcript_16785/m.49382 type:complete len:398 (-) Transcript_16785:1093-2286(-)
MGPRLAAHGFTIADLQYRPDARRPGSTLAPNPADISVVFELQSAQHIPEPAPELGFTVVARKARLATMHRESRRVTGNILLIRGAAAGARWSFAKGRNFVGGMNSDNVCLLRFSGDTKTHTLVIELSYTVKYEPQSLPLASAGGAGGAGGAAADVGAGAAPFVAEVSCGWTHVDLADVPTLVGKSHEQPVSGGSPDELMTVDLKPVVPGEGRTLKSSSFRRRSDHSRSPTISFRFVALKATAARHANELPRNLLVQRSLVPLLRSFRGYLLDSLTSATRAVEPDVPPGASPVYDPAAAAFIELCSHPVALALLRNRWRAECKARGKGTQGHMAKSVLQKLLLREVHLVVFSSAFSNPMVRDRSIAAATQAALQPGMSVRPPPALPFNVKELVVDVWP